MSIGRNKRGVNKLFKPATDLEIVNRPKPLVPTGRTGAVFYLDVYDDGEHLNRPRCHIDLRGKSLREFLSMQPPGYYRKLFRKYRWNNRPQVDFINFLGIQLPVIRALLPSLVLNDIATVRPIE